jgi:hypothetical protein
MAISQEPADEQDERKLRLTFFFPLKERGCPKNQDSLFLLISDQFIV